MPGLTLQAAPAGYEWVTGSFALTIGLVFALVFVVRTWRADVAGCNTTCDRRMAEKDAIIAQKDLILSSMGQKYLEFLERHAEVKP
jgi:hypothetical protein